jgi:lipid A 3-O-deacylase
VAEDSRLVPDGLFDLGFSYWDQKAIPEENGSVFEVGLAPVLRLTTSRRFADFQPFLDVGVGVHYLSDDEYGDHEFGHHAFSPRVGAGLLYGPFEFGYRFMHYSNANTADDNDSVEFHASFAGYHFQ